MNNQYDVIVVGAGNAGLSAAITVQKAGYKTLIIEKNHVPGGCAASFMMGRFEVDPTIHQLCSVGSIGNNGAFASLLESYGINFERIPLKDCFRVVSHYSDGTPADVTMPVGVDAFIDSMEKEVPDSRKSMEKLFYVMKQTVQGSAYAGNHSGFGANMHMFFKYRDFLKSGSYSAYTVMKAAGLPGKAIDIMSSYWSFLGSDLHNLSFVHYANMVYDYVSKGPVIPEHTCSEISMNAQQVFQSLGGRIIYGCKVRKLLTDGKTVTGVYSDAGVFTSKIVIANINQTTVYTKMLPDSVVTSRQEKLLAMRKDRLNGRPFTCYIGLDVPYRQLGIKDCCVLISESLDSEKSYKACKGSIDGNFVIDFTCPNVVNPSASPDGTCICSITMFCGARDWEEIPQSAYFLFKDRLLDRCLDILEEKVQIKLRGHIEEVYTASPWTFARFVGAPQGSTFGYECSGSDNIVARLMSKERDYDVPGLYTCGSGGIYGNGYNGTFEDGHLIGIMACNKLEKVSGSKA